MAGTSDEVVVVCVSAGHSGGEALSGVFGGAVGNEVFFPPFPV